jgi:prophage regulatory protein
MDNQTVTIIKEVAAYPLSSIYVSDAQIANRYEVSRNTIWRWVRNKTFPAPIKLSPGCTRFKLADVEAWEAAK